jgi:LPS-assembly protein
MNKCLIALLLLTLLPCLAWAQTPPEATEELDPADRSITPFLRGVLDSDELIVLEADQVEFDGGRQRYEARGNVAMRQKENVLYADHILLDLHARVLIADGNIRLVAPEGEVRATRLELKLDSETAVVARAEFVVFREEATYFMRGRRIEKIGPERYLIYEGHYTTCDCGPDEADWMVTAEFIDVTFDGYAVVERGRIHLFGLPVTYVPYGIFPAKVNRATGFLWPETGWASDDGYRVGLPFYWNIDRHTDATIMTDWYSKRGTKVGLEHRYLYNRLWWGETNVDVLEQDRLENDQRRWAISFQQEFNPTGRLFFRNDINLISDNDYVVDFPRDIEARFDSQLRSDFILNNLWENYDLNVSARHWDNLTVEDNSYTWQQYPHATFNAEARALGVLPVFYRVNAGVTNFYRPKISDRERAADTMMGHERPFTYLTGGRRVSVMPEVFAPLNFNQYATLTPYVLGEGTVYQLNDRHQEGTPGRATVEPGALLSTRFERVFPVRLPRLRGIKHQIEPSVQYSYRNEPDQDALPIFDGQDRLRRLSDLSYGLTNRLWMRLFEPRRKRFSTFRLTDLRVLHGYDFAEGERALDPFIPDDERRPWHPWTVEFETVTKIGRLVDNALVRSELDYDTYMDEVSRFNALGTLGTVRDDAIGAEYRYHVADDGEIDISYLSGLARYHLVDFLSFDYLARYSFLDSYFVEQRYGMELHSLQDCWHLRLTVEQRELPERETVYLILADFTGLLKAATAF